MRASLRCVRPSSFPSPADVSAVSVFPLQDPVSVLRFCLPLYSTIVPVTHRVQLAQLIPQTPAFRTDPHYSPLSVLLQQLLWTTLGNNLATLWQHLSGPLWRLLWQHLWRHSSRPPPGIGSSFGMIRWLASSWPRGQVPFGGNQQPLSIASCFRIASKDVGVVLLDTVYYVVVK
jgi:hypothetical protein